MVKLRLIRLIFLYVQLQLSTPVPLMNQLVTQLSFWFRLHVFFPPKYSWTLHSSEFANYLISLSFPKHAILISFDISEKFTNIPLMRTIFIICQQYPPRHRNSVQQSHSYVSGQKHYLQVQSCQIKQKNIIHSLRELELISSELIQHKESGGRKLMHVLIIHQCQFGSKSI